MNLKMVFLCMCIFIFSAAIIPHRAYGQTYLKENSTWEQNLTKVAFSSVAWGDLDIDGDLDLALSGCTYISGTSCSNYISKIYTNDGSSLTENEIWGGNLTSVNVGSLEWGDIDNDGDLDLVLSGCNNGGGALGPCSNGQQTFVYTNNGSSLVENLSWQENLDKVAFSDTTLGDVDNDGDLDLILSGQSSSAKISKVYINNGTTFVENSAWQQFLIGVYMCSLDLGDIDNDGDLDLVLTGGSGSAEITEIYINNGSTFLEDGIWDEDIIDLDESSASFGDYDNDGDLDLMLIGHNVGDRHRVYENNGSTFVLHDLESWNGGNFAGIFDGSISWGDYDNDGDLDIASTGYEAYTRVYRNNNTNFENSQENLMGLENGGSICWADVDKDKDLDLISTGYGAGGRQTFIYTNNISSLNNLPNPPDNVFNETFNFSAGKLTLSWGNGSDTETPTLGLYYNLRVGTCSGCHDVVSGVFGGGDDNGYFGNMMQRKSITLNRPDLENETIYWAVQTIDTGLAKSAWSDEQVYEIVRASPPCQENWTYGEWSSCVSSQQTRSATDLNGCGTEINKSETTRSCSTYVPPSGGSTPPSGPSTPPKEPGKPENATGYFEKILAGVDTGISLNESSLAIRQVWIKVKNEANEVAAYIKKLDSRPLSVSHEPEGNVYQYLNITYTNLPDSEIESCKILFGIEKQWIENNSINKSSVSLLRFHGNEWQSLPTSLKEEDSDFVKYEADSPGFSIFALVGKVLKETETVCIPMERKCLGNELLVCSEDGIEWVLLKTCEYGCEGGSCKEKPIGFGSDFPFLLPLGIAVFLILLVGGIVLHRKCSSSKSPLS